MIEWQNESSLFTIRIQGKQWYWVYKYNSDTDYRIKNVYLNVGNNNWFKTSNSSKFQFTSNNSTLIYSFEYEFKKIYNTILNNKEKLNIHLNALSYNNNINLFKLSLNNDIININELNNVLNKKLFTKTKNIFITKITPFNLAYNDLVTYSLTKTEKLEDSLANTANIPYNNSVNIFKLLLNKSVNKTYFENDRLEDVEESSENLRYKNNNFPIKLIKGVLNKHNNFLLTTENNLKKNILLSYRTNSNDITKKISQIEQFWGFRQKRYKKLKAFSFSSINKYNNTTYTHISNFLNNENFKKYNLYGNIKNNKYKSELIPLSLAKRLLRTKRTLVLPAHINLTLITGSYDVVHSWFVPGLGLKIDCVPGRSTHHSLYIDNIGFYYGQCAEICGRYHHHMPIRICALNFEHFVIWWNHKGLPRMYRSDYYLKAKNNIVSKLN